jgi:hypothetical protein
MGCSSTVSGLETIVVTVLAPDGEAISTYTNSIAQDGGLNAFSYQIRFQSTDFQPTGQVKSPPNLSVCYRALQACSPKRPRERLS